MNEIDGRQISRRCFVRRAGGMAAAGAAPYFVPRHVLAAPGRPGANDRVGIGYIGVGRRANQLMGLPKAARIVAASDVNHPRVDAVAAARKCHAYHDYRALLDAKDVDAVIVATPDHWHTLPSIHACQAGKDVYCEKPMTLTIREGRLLVQAVRKHARVFQTGSQQRSMAANRLGCQLVRNGWLGKVHTIVGFNYPSPWRCGLPAQAVPAGLDWDAWCGQTPVRPYHEDLYRPRANPGWISFRSYSGGEMTGWGAHGLDQVQWALGMDQSGPVEIWTEGPPFVPPLYRAPESRQRGDALCSQPHVLMRYASGTVLKLADGPHGGATFIGEKGRITIDRGHLVVNLANVPQAVIRKPEIHLAVSSNHLQNWIDCIKSRARPVADVEIGHRSATVCHLGNIARQLGRRLHWDPEKEVFPDDPQANALVARRQRKPYALPAVI